MTMSNAIQARYELTPMQQGMLFHALYDAAGDAYFIQIRARLDGPLDAAAFEAAWQRLAQRHPVLRTAFAWQRSDGPQQVVWQHARVPVHRVDGTAWPTAEIDARLAALAQQDRQQGFDLARAPLLRVTLVTLQPGRHQLVWSLHHLLVDGWSLSSLMHELLEDYRALAEGRDSPFPARPPFEHYVHWLSQQPRGLGRAFWELTLQGLDEATALAAGRTAGSVPAYGECALSLAPQDSDALVQLAGQAGVTLGNLMLGAWGLCLSRWCGRADVVAGVTVSGRPEDLAGAQDIVGLLINTLPLRLRVDESIPITDWLRTVQAAMVAVQRHAQVPLVDIQQWSGLGRQTPLFDHLFVFENYPLAPAAGPIAGLVVAEVASSEPTDYPLTVVVLPGRSLTVQFSVDTQRLGQVRAEAMLAHYGQVLQELARARGDAPLHGLSMVPPHERHWLLHRLNDTATLPPRPLVHAGFQAQAAAHPDRIAAVIGPREVPYWELAARAHALAGELAAAGVGPDVPVAVFVPRSLEMLVSVLAVAMAGGACVPLDIDYPDERLVTILGDARPPVLLTDAATATQRPGVLAAAAAARVIALDASAAWGPAAFAAPPPPAVTLDPQHLFYIVYTSGSTGRPKGIALTHEAMANLVDWHRRTLPPAPRMLQFASLGFDASFHEIYAAWMTGGCVVMIDDAQRRDFAALLQRVHEQRADRVILPVVVLQRWAVDHADEPRLFEHLRDVITTGEQLQITRAVQELFHRLPQARLHNHYGPAETHVVTAHTLQGAPDQWPAYPVVGGPLQNTTAYVLDAWRQPVPAGVAGELYLGGANLARGYWGRPDLTADRFVPHPLPTRPGERLYRTGDQARWTPGGELEFLGRRDLMVKIRGFRVELGEVEAVLGEHPAMASCAVLLREDRPGDRILVAYCVPKRPGALPVAALRAHLLARLPDYMVPSAWVGLQALPLNTNGKVHRRALPAPAQAGLGAPGLAPGRQDAPTDAIETLLAGIWADVLGLPQVGLLDHFFERGGHSLRAVQVIARVRSTLKLTLPLRVLFEHPQLLAFAAAVRARQAGRSPLESPAAPAIPRRPDPTRAPLSHAQERFFVLDQLNPGVPVNQVAGVLVLQGPLDEPALARAWRELQQRHEPLRSRIAADGGHAWQVIEAQGRPYERSAVQGDPQPELLAFCSQPLPVPGPVLVRARLVSLGSEHHLLAISAHHAAIDGESIPVLMRDLATLYAQAAGHDAPQLPALDLQYADLAHAERSAPAAASLPGLSFWAEALRGLASLALPLDHPRPPVQGHRGGTVALTLDAHTAARTQALARHHGVTEAMLHLAVFGQWLSRLCGQDDVAIGMPISLRHRQEHQDRVGLFLNTVVVRLRPGRGDRVAAWLHRVRETLLQAHAHAEVPFDRVVQELDPPRDRSRSPLFQAMFDHHGWTEDEIELGGLRWSTMALPDAAAKFDLTLTVEATRHGQVELLLEFDHDLLDRRTAEGWLGVHHRLLDAFVDAMEQPVADLPLDDPAQRAQVRHWQTGPQREPAAPSIVPQLLRQLAVADGRPALADARGVLSRPELGRAVQRLAHALRRHGVGHEAVVGLHMARSREFVIAMLAVLAAGGAYLPLDPDHPPAHRARLLARAGARLVIGEGQPAPEVAAVCAWLDAHAEATAAPPGGPWGAPPDPRQLAYVLFTSGSTGEPKGVQIEHGALSSYLDFALAHYAPDGRPLDMAWFTAATFDLTVTSLFLPLLSGGTLRIVPPEATPVAQLEIALQDTDAVKLTPSHLSMLAMHPMHVPRLRVAIVGGEALMPEQIRALRACAPSVRVVNEYGPTEATVGCVVATVTGDDARTPIGAPIDRFAVRLVDERLQPLPPGWEGELLLQGPGLARGYLGRPDLTAERFLPDPEAAEPGARVYRSGDRARWRDDGRLDYFGRRDHQVKIRGHRIEPAEIEAALARQAGVMRAVVVPRAGPAGLQLLAYVQAAEPWQAGAALQRLRRELPAPLLPSAVLRVDHWPLTHHGKLDIDALPTSTGSQDIPPPAPDEAPATALQALLQRTWATLLRRPAIGLDDNFFSLGGDSITALQLAAAVQREGQPMPADAVFRHQTVRELAQALARDGVAPVPPAAQAEAEAGPLRPTPVQQWYLAQPQPQPAHHAQAFVLTLARQVDPAWVRRALDRLVADHPALRLRAGQEAPAWALSIAPLADPPMAARPLQVFDWRAASADEAQVRLRDLSATLQRGTQLGGGQLLEAALAQGPQADWLVLSVHHLAVDGVSWRILLEEFEHGMAAAAQGREPAARPEPCSLRRWTDALAERSLSQALAAQRPHWLAVAALARQAPPSPADGGLAGDEQVASLRLDADDTRRLLLEPAARASLGLGELLLAAFTAALAPPGQVLHVMVEGHGRLGWTGGLDLSRTVGWLTALYPVCWRRPASNAPGLLVRAAAAALRAAPEQGLGYGVLRELHPDPAVRAALALPTAAVLFNFHGQVASSAAPDAWVQAIAEAPGAARDAHYRRPYPLEVMGAVIDGELELSVTYHPAQHSGAQVQRWLQASRRELETFEPVSGHLPSSADGPVVAGLSLSEEDLGDLERELLG